MNRAISRTIQGSVIKIRSLAVALEKPTKGIDFLEIIELSFEKPCIHT